MRYLILLLVAPLLATDVTVRLPDGTTSTRTLNSHPRGIFDGASGTLTANIKDPDGSGSLKAPTYNSTAALALRQRVTAKRYDKIEEATGWQALHLALGNYMNNQETIASGKTYISELQDVIDRAAEDYRFGGCSWDMSGCGNLVGADYAGEHLRHWASAYTLAHDYLDATHLTKLRKMLFNGVSPPQCDSRDLRRDGIVVPSGTSRTITGASWHSSIVVGSYIGTENVAANNANGVTWEKVLAINGDTITTDTTAYPTVSQMYYHTLAPWSDTSCGFMRMVATHSVTPAYLQVPDPVNMYDFVTLTASMTATSPNPPAEGGVSEVITVNTSDWRPRSYDGTLLNPPFYARIGPTNYENASEAVLVTAISGTSITITRGILHGTTSHNVGEKLYYFTFGRADPTSSLFGLDNRGMGRAPSFIALYEAIADEDSGAVSLLSSAIDYFYTYAYIPFKTHGTLQNVSGVDYGLGRGMSGYGDYILYIKNAFTVPVDYATGSYLTNNWSLFNIYWSNAWNNNKFDNWGIETGENSCAPGTTGTGFSSSATCLEVAMDSNIALSGTTENGYMNYHMQNVNSYYSGRLTQAELYTDHGPQLGNVLLKYLLLGGDYTTWTYTDYTSALPTTKIWPSGDLSAPGTGLATAVSRTDWTTSSTQLHVMGFNGYSDKYNYADPHSSYTIGKGSMLIGNTRTNGAAIQADGIGYNQSIDFGNAFKAGVRVVKTDLPQTLLGKDGGSNYGYVSLDALRTNDNNGSYHHVTRQFRQFAHFKTSPEYIIVYDDVAKTGTPERVRDFIHYLNNAESGEGTTQFDTGANFVTSTNATSPTAKIISQFLLGDGDVTKVYDLGVKAEGGASTSTIGIDCSASAPCRVRTSSTVYSYTAPVTFQAVGPASPTVGYVYVYVANDGTIHVGRDSNMVSLTVTSGTATNDGVISDFPGDAIVRLSKQRWINSIVDNSVGKCPGAMNVNVSTAAREWGSCVGSQARVAFMDAGATNSAEFIAVHRPTSTLAESAVTATSASVGSTACGASNFRMISIPASTPTYAVFPKAQSKYTCNSFTLSHSGSARLLVMGMTAGDYTVTRNGGAFSTPTIASDGTYYTASATSGDYVFTFDSALAFDIETTTLPDGPVNGSYDQQISVVGGLTPYANCSISAGALPTGLTIANSVTGCRIYGTPTVIQSSVSFTVSVDDATSPTPQNTTQAYTVSIIPQATLSITTTTLPNGQDGVSYSTSIVASGGTQPYSCSKTGTLPTGITLSSGCALSGTPTETGDFSIAVTVTDSASPTAGTATRNYSFTITSSTPPPSVTVDTVSPLPGGVLGTYYEQGLVASGGTQPYTWTNSTQMPSGLTLSSGGVISGTPSGTAGTKCVDVVATDNNSVASTATTLCLAITAPASKLRVRTLGLSVLVEFTLPGLDAAATCSYSITDSMDVEQASGTIAAGIASRKHTATLPGAGTYTDTITCPNYTETISLVMATTSGTGTYTVHLKPPSNFAATHARLLVGSVGGALSAQTPAACFSGCDLTYTASKGNYDLQWQFCRDSGCTDVAATSRTKTVAVQ